MFNYYRTGIKSKLNDTVYTVEELIKVIKDNPYKKLICELQLEEYKSERYMQIKEKLPCITPAGLFRNARLADQFMKASGYLFFEIDMPEINTDINDFKNHILNEFGSYICLLGKSVGGRGLFFYIKVEGVSKDNYTVIYEYYRTKVFKELNTDNNAKGINRAHIIPHDPEVHVNLDISLSIPKELLIDTYEDEDFNSTTNEIGNKDDNKKETVRIKNNKRICYTPNVSFLPIDQVLSSIRTETLIESKDELFKVDPVNYNRLYIPPKIKDGKKHSTFRALTHGLMYHNPSISLLMIQSYVNYINQNHTSVPMTQKEMLNTVQHAYNQVIETGEVFIPLKTKKLHFNKEVKMFHGEKSRIASKVNGLIKTFISVAKIERAIEALSKNNIKLTKKNIASEAGISLKTLERNSGKTLVSIMEAINALNRTIDGGVLDTQNLDETIKLGICKASQSEVTKLRINTE